MKIAFETKALRAALGKVKYSIPRRSTLPVLHGVRIAATEGGVILTTTDLDQAISVWCDASVLDSSGDTSALVVGHKELSDAVKGTAREVEIENDGDDYVVVRAGASTTLHTLDISEYPLILNNVETDRSIKVSGLSGALKRCIGFVSDEPTRHFLNGIYLHLKDGVLRAVATDGKMMKVLTLGEGYASDEGGMILPNAACKSIIALKLDSDSEISCSPVHAIVKENGVMLVTRLIDGEYPDYAACLGGVRSDVFVSVDRGAFRDALKSVTWWKNTADSERRGVVIEPGGDGIVKLTTDTVEQRSETTFPGTWTGSARFSLNPYYAYEALDSMGVDEVQLEIQADGLGPVGIVGAENEATVLMPRRINHDPLSNI